MKINKKELLRSRRGVTITEVVIALTIIGIISSAALTTVMHSLRVETQSFTVIEAENAAENALACFRYAEDENEFTEALCKTGAYEKQDDGSLVLSEKGYTVTVRADYSENYFEYNAVNSDGVEIYSFYYPNVDSEGGVS